MTSGDPGATDADTEADTADAVSGPQPRLVHSIDVDIVRQFASTTTTLLGQQSRDVHPRETLTELCRRYVETTGADEASVMLVDRDRNQLVFVAGAGGGAGFGDVDSIPLDQTTNWYAEACRSVRPILVDDVSAWPDDSRVKTVALDRHVRSSWVTPLVALDGTCLGTFAVGWSNGEPAHRDQRWLFNEFGILAAAIVERRQSHWQRIALIEQERERIAGELHDDSVQAMTAVSLRLQQLKMMLTDEEQRGAVDDLRSGVDTAIERLRHMLFSLASPTLAEDGLVVTLEIYLEAYVEPNGLDWELTGDEDKRFPPNVESLAFRLARGAVINVIKHARASKVRVGVEEDDDGELVVTVADDGVGFDPAVHADSHRRMPGHIGLSYAHSLAAAVGGTYQVESSPGAGTTVRFRIPRI